MRVVRVPTWGLWLHTDAAYYFARFCMHVGPWLVFVGTVKPTEQAARQDINLR